MRVLMVNKFLYPKGGAETYVLKLGKELEKLGHEVEYFGMYDEKNTVGNKAGAYTGNKEFRAKITPAKLLYPFDIVYSRNARKQIRKVLDDFKPDVVHLNNINFQITPSIIYEIKKDNIPVVWTAHDYQLVCPNHLLYIMQEGRICTECLSGKYRGCLKNKCLHGSRAKSLIAMIEGWVYRRAKAYSMVDQIICPSRFLQTKLETREEFQGKCETIYNFVDKVEQKEVEMGNYVLYFGRFDSEKGIKTLIEVCKKLPQIHFVFAGGGELEHLLTGMDNVENVGFKTGEELEMLIRKAVMTVYPSEWYENCPFSVIESQMYGVPVVGSRMGGIPELVEDGKTGLLFEAGNQEAFAEKISLLWDNRELRNEMSRNALVISRDDGAEYCNKLVEIFEKLMQ